MPARHDAPVPGRSRLAPTALNAVVAVMPATSLAAAFGLAGGGYLTGREDVAACGALAGAFGLVVERLQTRSVRVRLRRERSRHHGDLQEVSRLLQEVQRDLAGLRADLDDVRAERDAVRAELQTTLGELATARASVAEVEPAHEAEPVLEVEPVPEVEPVLEVERVPEAEAGLMPMAPLPMVPLPLAALVPGQARSPIATGGIPILAPGPREPVRTIDLRSAHPGLDDETYPLPVLTADLADALVYAAMAEADAADADELTRVMEGTGSAGRHAGPLHTGDAHHAGDYTREPVTVGDAAPTLVVVRRGKHVA